MTESNEQINGEAILNKIKEMNVPIVPAVEALAANIGGILASKSSAELRQTVAIELGKLLASQLQFCSFSADQTLSADQRQEAKRSEYACIAVSVAIDKLTGDVRSERNLRLFLTMFRKQIEESLGQTTNS